MRPVPANAPDRFSRLAVFAAFAALAAGGWGSLVADPPVVRLVLAALIATGTAAALAALGPELPRGRRIGLVAVIAFAGLVPSLVALGVPANGLVPWGWGSLAEEVDRGFGGLSGNFDYPYAGENETSRWLLTAAMPLLLIAGAVAAFGRSRRPGPKVPALLLLVAAFAIPATIRPADAPLLWGAVLLVLVSLWLWRRPRHGVAAVATVACFGALAVPIASGLEEGDPVLDYRDWTLPEPASGTGFDWDQSYGPITWERTDDVLFEVRTDEPRYLRAEVLDDFYGYGWQRSKSGAEAVAEDADPTEGTLGTRGEEKWVQSARVSVGDLESPLVISPGTEFDLSGVDGAVRDPDGTVNAIEDPLTKGTDYSITAYAPDPGPKLMRARSTAYSKRFDAFTTIAYPYSEADPESGLVTVHRVPMPLWGSDGAGPPTVGGVAAAEIARSPYDRVARLAERLTASSPTAYDAAKRVEAFIRNRGTYSESPDEHAVPLRSFLFDDKTGYCQHFSGAMALILRFAGIPTRVAAGFTPGERQGAAGADESTYAVTGFDAHSWVEVYFNGIGWVPFDPTPSAAPNRSQAGSDSPTAIAGETSSRGNDERRLSRAREPGFGGGQGLDPTLGAREPEGGPGLELLLFLLIPLVALSLFSAIRAIRHRRLGDEEVADLELRELADALGPAGLDGPGLSTLRRLEEHLKRLNLPAAASYVGRLAALRFAPSPGRPPTLSERRAARRELSSGGGPARFLRMLVAMPPGGPRRKMP